MTSHALCRTLFVAPLAAMILGSFAAAQTTTATRLIGGPGGLTSCGAFNPPTLCDGITQASASVQFTYNAATTTLTLAVDNTSPVTTGVVNPVMTSLYFNVPVGAVNAIALTGQSAAGATQPGWTLTFDSDLQALPNPNFVHPFGRFNACLFGNPSNGIANPLADTLAVPPGSEIIGPVTFQFAVTPATGATLNASTFANAFSITNAAGKNVNTAAHFNLDACGGSSGCLSNAPSCSPSAFMTGTPRIGCTVKFTMTAAPGCAGCLAVSPNPGPTIVTLPAPMGALSIPIGLPMEVLINTSILPNSTFVSQWFTIPNDTALIGLTMYGCSVVLNMQTGLFSVSQQFQFSILPP